MKNLIRLGILGAFFGLCACASSKSIEVSATKTEDIDIILQKMSLREKVGQMFIINPEYLNDTAIYQNLNEILKHPEHASLSLSDNMRKEFEKYPVGGFILFGPNLRMPQQVKTFNSQLHSLSYHPFVCVDEEGGRVVRIANNPAFGLPKFESMQYVGNTKDPLIAYNAGKFIGNYLKQYGIDVNFAPVVDVNTNPDNPIIGVRSFNSDPHIAASMSMSWLKGLTDEGVVGCLKHFPGHGDTKEDSHLGQATSTKTWAEMLDCEIFPFKEGIKANAPMIMVSHIMTPNVSDEGVPATLSSVLIQEKLRKELGYKGVIITDAMDMHAITNYYSNSTEATLSSIYAGVDIVLVPINFCEVFEAVLQEVKSGKLSEKRIDESVRRILLLKRKAGML